MIRKCGQIVFTDNKRTFTNFLGANKDTLRHDPIRGNDNVNTKLLDCTSQVNTSGSHDQSEDTRNCRVYMTKFMFLVKLNT